MSASEEKVAWSFQQSDRAKATRNFIREVVDQIKIPQAPEEKPLIPLSLGDPSSFGNFPPPPTATNALVASVQSNRFNGYGPAHGHKAARDAIAQKYSLPEHALTADDIMIASGCSDALKIAIHSVVGQGDNLLVPCPGFSLYITLAVNNFAEARSYNLLPNQKWECDIKHMESLVDENTKAVVINNPSNPCGANYSREHLLELIAFAKKHKLLIIADEIYAGIVFQGETFTTLPSLDSSVPMIVTGGIAKQYCCPGWRLGWLVFYDRNHVLRELRAACQRMTQLIVGCNTLIQGALPEIILNTPAEYYTNFNLQLERQAHCMVATLQDITGLRVILPQGAMYLMVQIDMPSFPEFATDLEFSQALLDEEFVFVLPGSAFKAHGFFRVVFVAPEEKLQEAGQRIRAFCQRHYVAQASANRS